ncbi:MAG: succinate dehydrogenase [Chloroflexota bacterium]
MTVEASSVRNSAPRTMPGRQTWWVQPALTAAVLTAFGLYSFWSIVFAGNSHDWQVGPYSSPYYSPLIRFAWWPFSVALWVFWSPLAFRATCYYYRKAYYRSFFLDPPSCALGEPQFGRYTGERKFPFILNNSHRYFLYVALIVLGFLWYDTVNAFQYRGSWYIGAGSILMLLNVVLLSGYTFSCHALRHFVGGGIDCYSCMAGGSARHGMWSWVTKINPRHGTFAWFSLVSVVLTDVYIRLVAGGVFGAGCFGAHTGC